MGLEQPVGRRPRDEIALAIGEGHGQFTRAQHGLFQR